MLHAESFEHIERYHRRGNGEILSEKFPCFADALEQKDQHRAEYDDFLLREIPFLRIESEFKFCDSCELSSAVF